MNLNIYVFHMSNVYVMFFLRNTVVYQKLLYFKSENLCFFNLFSDHATRILNLALKII